MKYTVYLSNMGHSLPDVYPDEVAAIDAGKATGFEFSVHNHGVMVGYFTIPGGYHYMHDTTPQKLEQLDEHIHDGYGNSTKFGWGPLADDHARIMSDMQCTTLDTDHII